LATTGVFFAMVFLLTVLISALPELALGPMLLTNVLVELQLVLQNK
jgi:hypothetical protein